MALKQWTGQRSISSTRKKQPTGRVAATPWWMLRGCLAAVLFRIMSRQLRETEIQDKWVFAFVDGCSYAAQPGLGAVAGLPLPRQLIVLEGGSGPTGSRGWIESPQCPRVSQSVTEGLVLHRHLGIAQPWPAQVKVTVPLLGGQPKKKGFILTCHAILREKTSSEHAELWFWVAGTKAEESSKMRQLSWRTQQGCVGWVLKCSPTLQKPLPVPWLCRSNVWWSREDHSPSTAISLCVIKIFTRSESSLLFQ